MSRKLFNEDTRVKIPATIQFLRIGYNYQSLSDASIDFETKIFVNRFKTAIENINGRTFSDNEVIDILMEINSVIKNNDLGKEFYNWLINPLDRVSNEHLTNNLIAIPVNTDNYIINDFEKIISPFFDKQAEIIKENQQLASLRDWLLPMLMNGQVGFEEVERL